MPEEIQLIITNLDSYVTGLDNAILEQLDEFNRLPGRIKQEYDDLYNSIKEIQDCLAPFRTHLDNLYNPNEHNESTLKGGKQKRKKSKHIRKTKRTRKLKY